MSPLLPLLLFQEKPPVATVTLSTPSVAVGKQIAGTLTLRIPKGLHGYQNPPADGFENPIELNVAEKGFRLIRVTYPKGITHTVPGLPKPTKIYTGTINIPFLMVAKLPSPKGAVTQVNFKLRYQFCSETTCWRPRQMIVRAPLRVTE